MDLIETHELNKAAMQVSRDKDWIVSTLQGIGSRLDYLVALKTIYPDRVDELDALIAQAKTALINLANNY